MSETEKEKQGKLIDLQCANLMPFLTVHQASVYFNINEKKIRELVDNYENELVINNGWKRLIKKAKLETYLNCIDSI